VRVAPHGDADTHPTGKPEQVHVEVLAVGIPVDLQCDVMPPRLLEDDIPARTEPDSEIEDPPARVCEHVDPRVAQRGKIPIGLIVAKPKFGVERTQHQVE